MDYSNNPAEGSIRLHIEKAWKKARQYAGIHRNRFEYASLLALR
ncbi:hypothetical protein [Enterovibrio qingdaonensis]|nr:hypothetical protein [Enterovibrio sp. ZSDZ35]